MNCSLGISNFLEEISSLSHSVVFLYFFALFTEEGFLISLAIFWNSAFRCLYLSFSPLLFASLLFTAICKASPDSHFAFLHFFSMGMVLIPGVTGKFGLGIWNEAGQRLIEFCQENALVIENTLFQQHKRRLYTWTSPDGQHRNQIDYILCSRRWRNAIQSAKTRLGADCGSDHELLLAKSDLNLESRENR